MGLRLSAAEVAALETRTEGWIAGLQMAAISLTGHGDPAGFLQSFAGSHRFILDYLVEEVLQQQPERVRRFLFQTSGLPRFSAALCDAVTGQNDGQELLAVLERGNMLIVPLDDQRRWYRYHQLFADVLQSYARTTFPDQVPVWQQRASRWYEQHGFRADAIQAAFAAGDAERAADLVEQSWPVILNGFPPATWLQWAQSLPEDLLQARPVLSAGYAWLLLDNGELAAAAQRLDSVDGWLDRVASGGQAAAFQAGMLVANETQFALLTATTASARAYHALALGDAAGAIEQAQRALALLPASEHYWRGTATLFLGLAQWAGGELAAAYQSLTASIASQREAGNQYFQVFGTVMLADIRVAQGHLQAALRHYEQALQMLSPGAPVPGNRVGEPPLVAGPVALYVGLSELYRIWGRLDTAGRYVAIGQNILERAILPGSAHRLFCVSARITATQGDYPAALEQLREAEHRYQATAVPDVQPIAALEARIWLQQGQVARALHRAQQQALSLHNDLRYEDEFAHITLARILIAAGRQQQSDDHFREALELLERLQQAAETGERTGSLIEICLLQAIAYQARGEDSAADGFLARSLRLAEPEGFLQVFVDEGPTIQALLARSLARNPQPAYAKQVLNHIRRQSNGAPLSPETNQILIEPLSKRELEILQLLAGGHSNQAIADELVIALSTVKKHVNNIFGKLDVDSRTQAIQRARDLNILH
jgi:LuxR family maltose regulon positive regulatory protein